MPGWANFRYAPMFTLDQITDYADALRGQPMVSLSLGIAIIAALSIGWAAIERASERRHQHEMRRRDEDDARSRDA